MQEPPTDPSINPYESPQAEIQEPERSPVAAEPVEPINPWLGIWFKPRQTMQYLMTKPSYGLLPIAGYLIFMQTLFAIAFFPIGSNGKDSLTGAWKFTFAVTTFGSLLLAGLLSSWCTVTRGRRRFIATLAAVLWAQIPGAFSALLWLVAVVIMTWTGQTTPDALSLQNDSWIILIPLRLTQLLWLWSLVALCFTLSVAHEMRPAQAFRAMFVAMFEIALLVLLVIVALVVAFVATCLSSVGR